MTSDDTRQSVKKHPAIYTYTTKAGVKLYGVWYDHGTDWKDGKRQQRKRQGFTTLADAITFRDTRRKARRDGDETEPSAEPLGAYLLRWIDSRGNEIRPNTIRLYRAAVAWFEPIANTPISRLTPSAVESFYRSAGRELSPGTIHVMHAVLTGAMKQALRDHAIRANPCEAVRKPRIPEQKPKGWTSTQMAQFLEVTPDHPEWGPVWRLMLKTWMRPGELLALRWKDVDLDAGDIAITRTVTRTVANKTAVGDPKSTHGRRIIRLDADLVDALRAHRDRQRFDWHRFGRTWTDEQVIVPNQNGGMLTRQQFGIVLARLCEAAGVPVITPHELRHTGGSVAYFAHVNPKIVSERMGHSSVHITENVYTHSNEALHREAADQIAALIDGKSRARSTSGE